MPDGVGAQPQARFERAFVAVTLVAVIEARSVEALALAQRDLPCHCVRPAAVEPDQFSSHKTIEGLVSEEHAGAVDGESE